MKLTSKVLKLLRKSSYAPSTDQQIYKNLKEPDLSFGQLKKALEILEAEEKVTAIGSHSFDKLRTSSEEAVGRRKDLTLKYVATAKGPDILRGRFEANNKGFGFVITPKVDIYVRSDKVNNALHGDLVEVRITRRRKKRNLEGVIIGILERSLKEIIGRVEVVDGQKWLIPSDRRLQNVFLIKNGADLVDGQMIVAQIAKYPPQGLVESVEVLGDEGSIAVEIEIILREHNLRVKWPNEVRKEAANLPKEVRLADLEGRKDYRTDYTVTIDGLDAKDFDDAVSLSKKGDKYHLTVHIADVSTYVEEGSPLDLEAKTRGNSTYLPDRVLPMFPVELSNQIASLNPDVDRLTLSVESIINSQGEVEGFEIHRGVIRSKARLTYEEVDESIKTGHFADKKQENLVMQLLQLQQILEKNRLAEGSLVFETIEPKVILDKELNPVEIKVRERSPATALIEETAIVTNEIIGKYMTKRKYPVIYRLHEEPAEDALTEVAGLLKSFSYPVTEIKSVSRKTYQNIIKFAHRRPDRLLINSVLIRSMKKARYSAAEKSHFGLALDYYCHFTSPIRRYADLVVHRQVKRMLDGKFDFDKEELTGHYQEIAEHVSVTETESVAAEREADSLFIALYMEDKVGEEYEAVITGMVHFGFFVQIPNSAEGLVHITSLRDDYYVFEPERYLIRGRRTGKVYRLGQKLKVRLIKVIVGERQLDFEVV